MYIASLRLTHIKAFDDLDLDFRRPDGDYAGFNVFVGGNASGKSTLLKAMAMAIAGPTVANNFLLTPFGWLRRESLEGSVAVGLAFDRYDAFSGGGNRPPSLEAKLTLKIDEPGGTPSLEGERRSSERKRLERGPWSRDSTGWFLAGYGPYRRLTGSSTDALRYSLAGHKLASLATLFREDAALSESENWFREAWYAALDAQGAGGASSDSTLFAKARDFLNSGVLPEGFAITRVTAPEGVFMSTPNGGELPLRDLSDGCRSIYALMLDILCHLVAAYPGEDIFTEEDGLLRVDRPGVVLIDELESHLHPAWQRTVCEWLKERFPRLQFFVTTHSPLIAQAADPGGIFVLPLPEELAAGKGVRRLSFDEQERISLGRAEKTLLGQAFGLHQTWSVRAERLVQRWEKLTALKMAKGQLPAEQERELAQIAEKVDLIFDDPGADQHHA